MNEDYLWDKSGEANPEIERLERSLSSLRYKRPAQPLPLPAASRTQFRSNNAWLAAAAAIALIILAGGLWLALHRSNSNGQSKAIAGSSTPKTSEPAKDVSGQTTWPIKSTERVADNGSSQSTETINQRATHNPNVSRTPVERRQEVTLRVKNRERALHEEETVRKGELAKEQLIKALQITGEKLNTIQKKIQGAQEHNPIS